MLVIFLVPSRSSNTPLYPQSATSHGTCPQLLILSLFHFKFTFESIKELGSASHGISLAFKKKNWFEKNMRVQNFGTIKVPNLGLPFGIMEKSDIVYFREGNSASSQRLRVVWNLCLRLSLVSSPHHFHSIYTNYLLFLVVRLISSWILACEFVLVPS